MLLSPTEIRVLGALAEKALTTPQQYPLSENALLQACNQTTNRDPVVHYDTTVVRRALKSLRVAGLAREVSRPGERVEKHRHLLDEALELSGAELAVLVVLMLRGPQTVGELRSRTDRLHAFATTEEVQQTLEQLADRSWPLARRLERVPGQKEARWTHLLTDPDADAETVPPASTAEADGGAEGEPPAPRISLATLLDSVEDLQARVAQLEAELAALRTDRRTEDWQEQPPSPASPSPPEVGSS